MVNTILVIYKEFLLGMKTRNEKLWSEFRVEAFGSYWTTMTLCIVSRRWNASRRFSHPHIHLTSCQKNSSFSKV